MATKKAKAADDDLDVDELFSGIGNESAPKRTPKPKSATSKVRSEQPQQDKLAELENLLGDQPARPHTPRIKETASKRSSTATPPPGAAAAGRLPEDKSNLPRRSGESSCSIHASFTPSATSSDIQDAEKKGSVEPTPSEPASSGSAAAGGGWWGGIFATASATATAAMKQAEAAYKEIQQNEDAQKYLEQVRGNVSVIRGYGKPPRGALG